MPYNSPEVVNQFIDKIDSDKFDKTVFEKTGVFILRNAIPQDLIKEWRTAWDEFYAEKLAAGRTVYKYNPVALEEKLPGVLGTLYKNEVLANYASQVWGDNVGIYHHRFVIKDKHSKNEVFLHQDYCYHSGFHNKSSFFIPLSYAGKENGGLTFYPGTHQYGFLGDAGEINPDNFKDKWVGITPELQPGDFAIMNSLLWHGSGLNVSGVDRIVIDTIYQPANDPSCIDLVKGEWQTDIFVDRENPLKNFKRSRVSRIIQLEEELKKSK